jgi:uncharacterized tellurite resistance protein B-like protein
MNKEEKVQYLANVYHVLLADGQVDRMEERAFEDISRDVGAGYFERREAMERAAQQGYRASPAGRWSQRIRNLEDMLFAAYSNGVLDAAEKTTVKQYAGQLGIDQKQFDRVIRETKERYAEFKEKSR